MEWVAASGSSERPQGKVRDHLGKREKRKVRKSIRGGGLFSQSAKELSANDLGVGEAMGYNLHLAGPPLPFWGCRWLESPRYVTAITKGLRSRS